MTARVIFVAVLVALLLILAGCDTAPRLQAIQVPIPMPCRAIVPVRPVMPTEALAPGVQLYAFVTAAQAEIERREGYEARLRAALGECVVPIEAAPAQ